MLMIRLLEDTASQNLGWVAILLPVPNVSGSNLGPETDYSD
jgi:hypothetical protein